MTQLGTINRALKPNVNLFSNVRVFKLKVLEGRKKSFYILVIIVVHF